MSYEEKGVWVALVVNVAVTCGYVAVMLGQVGGADGPWVAAMLWAIGIAIVASIVVRIGVEIVRPSDSYQSDDRDKDVNRRGEYVAGLVLGIAMTVPLALTLAEAAHFWIGNAMYAAFVVSAAVGATIKLVGYRRGM
jgi:FtsH-binding integral membrane protein